MKTLINCVFVNSMILYKQRQSINVAIEIRKFSAIWQNQTNKQRRLLINLNNPIYSPTKRFFNAKKQMDRVMDAELYWYNGSTAAIKPLNFDFKFVRPIPYRHNRRGTKIVVINEDTN